MTSVEDDKSEKHIKGILFGAPNDPIKVIYFPEGAKQLSDGN